MSETPSPDENELRTMSDLDAPHARLVGINHVALEVGDVEAAHKFYENLFEFDVRGRTETAIFFDMGDQFLALSEGDVD